MVLRVGGAIRLCDFGSYRYLLWASHPEGGRAEDGASLVRLCFLPLSFVGEGGLSTIHTLLVRVGEVCSSGTPLL